MKIFKAIVLSVLGVSAAYSETIILEGVDGSTLTTGDLIDEADEIGLTTNVLEISGLDITVRSGATNQDVNVTRDSLGVDSDGPEDDTDAIEDGESFFMSFSKTVEITQFDFNGFESNEVIGISIGGSGFDIGYDDLQNKHTDVFDTNMVLNIGTEVKFYVDTTNSIIGLDAMSLNVLGGAGDLTLSVAASNGMSFVFAAFDGAATTNYVLQSSTNLTTNVWTTISTAFADDTNLLIEAEHNAVYYRAIAE